MPRMIPVDDPDYTGRLRERLREQNLSLGVLARTMKMDRSQLARLFNTSAQPNWKTVVRIEAALEELGVPVILPGGFNDSQSAEEAVNKEREIKRLKQYREVITRLVETHDAIPTRWRYFQTEWLWRYARGLANGQSADDVKRRGIADVKRAQKASSKAPDEHLVDYVKLETFGGPADGQIFFCRGSRC